MVHAWFSKFAAKTAHAAGSVWVTGLAFASIILWAVAGVLCFGFGEEYQMILNSATTVVTFLMVFLIQNAQNREMLALNLKLNELIQKTAADNRLIAIEELTDEQLAELASRYHKLAVVYWGEVGSCGEKMGPSSTNSTK